MSMFIGRSSNARVTFYGHSFLTSMVVDSSIELMMRGRSVPYQTGAVAGIQVSGLISKFDRRAAWFGPRAANSGLVVIAGVNDYAAAKTGATVVAELTTLANNALAAGFDWVLPSTCPASTEVTGGEETERLAGNVALLALAGSAPYPNGVVDLAGSAALAANIAAGDGTHPSSIVGREIIAALHDPYLDTLLA